MASKLIDRTIQAAISEFARCGFAGAATKSIASIAKITEGSLFRLFGSKEKLFEQALRRAVADSFATGRFAEALQCDGGSLEEFRRAAKKGLRHLWDSATPDAIRLVDVALLERPELAQSVYMTEFKLTNGVLAELIEEERQAGRIRKDVDAHAAAQFLLLAISRHRFLTSCCRDAARTLGFLRPDPKAVDDFVDLWIQAIAANGNLPKNKYRSRSK